MHSYQCGRVGNGTIRSFFMVIKLKSFRLTFSAVKISHKRTVRWVLEFILHKNCFVHENHCHRQDSIGKGCS
uniref:Uncharacterized protein n=1 Tax=Setaria italica TaxID=4555 RepID=K3ZCU7_SETIT